MHPISEQRESDRQQAEQDHRRQYGDYVYPVGYKPDKAQMKILAAQPKETAEQKELRHHSEKFRGKQVRKFNLKVFGREVI